MATGPQRNIVLDEQADWRKVLAGEGQPLGLSICPPLSQGLLLQPSFFQVEELAGARGDAPWVTPSFSSATSTLATSPTLITPPRHPAPLPATPSSPHCARAQVSKVTLWVELLPLAGTLYLLPRVRTPLRTRTSCSPSLFSSAERIRARAETFQAVNHD